MTLIPGCLSLEPRGLPALAWNAARPGIQRLAEPGSRSLPSLDRPLFSLDDLSLSSSGHLRRRSAASNNPACRSPNPDSRFTTRLRVEPDLFYFELRYKF